MVPVKVLFVCTGNSCRSIMAEALLRQLGGNRYQSHSAGSNPAGQVHPEAIQCLMTNRITVTGVRSESWDVYQQQAQDLVVTVCDDAAAEECPIFSGDPSRIHWSIPDPALATGAISERAAVFQATFDQLRIRIEQLVREIDARGVSKSLSTILGSPSDTRAGENSL